MEQGEFFFSLLKQPRRLCEPFAIAALNPRLIDILLRSYGTAKSGVGISAMAVLRPDLMMKNVVPVVMAGIIAVSTLHATRSCDADLIFGGNRKRSTALSSRFLFLEIVCIPCSLAVRLAVDLEL